MEGRSTKRRLDYAAQCYNELTEARKQHGQIARQISSWRELEEAHSERIKTDKQERLRFKKNSNTSDQSNLYAPLKMEGRSTKSKKIKP